MQKTFDNAWYGNTRLKRPGVLSCFREMKKALTYDVVWQSVFADIEVMENCYDQTDQETRCHLIVWDDVSLLEEVSDVPVREDILEIVFVESMSDILKARLDARGIKVVLDIKAIPEVSVFIINGAMEKFEERQALKEKLAHQRQMAHYKNVFFSSVCHELKNPLNGISVAAGMLTNDLELHRRREYLEVIQTGIDMLHPIIGDMVDMTKIESGRIALKERTIHVARVIREIMVTNSILADQKGIVLRSYLDEEVSNILVGDGDRLKQILFNLVSNGIKYTDEGYVHIHCELLESSKDKEHVRFKVIDSGYGIPQEYHKAIFEPFERACETHSCRSFGLGLTVAKHLVELMGGKLRVESKLGCGSRFEFDVRLGKVDF